MVSESALARMREIQQKYISPFELVFRQPIDARKLAEELKNSQNYWMTDISAPEDCGEMIRMRGVEMSNWEVLIIDILADGSACYVCAPLGTRIEAVCEFADKYCADIYFDGKLIRRTASTGETAVSLSKSIRQV